MSNELLEDLDIRAARGRLAGGGKRLWTTLEEVVDDLGFRRWIEAEFPSAAPAFMDGDRRRFLELMGASFLLAGLTGCSEKQVMWPTVPIGLPP